MTPPRRSEEDIDAFCGDGRISVCYNNLRGRPWRSEQDTTPRAGARPHRGGIRGNIGRLRRRRREAVEVAAAALPGVRCEVRPLRRQAGPEAVARDGPCRLEVLPQVPALSGQVPGSRCPRGIGSLGPRAPASRATSRTGRRAWRCAAPRAPCASWLVSSGTPWAASAPGCSPTWRPPAAPGASTACAGSASTRPPTRRATSTSPSSWTTTAAASSGPTRAPARRS